MSAIEIFFSYSHKDEALREKLENQLSILKWKGLIEAWHNRKIGAGQEWANEIDSHLNTSQIILLLISADFMASKYCYGKEMQRAMERHENGEACVIPIILRPCDWKDAPFSKLKALPPDGKPITDWRNRDKAYSAIAEGIRLYVESVTEVAYKDRKSSSKRTENNQQIFSNPYRGLSAFRVEDEPFFFGREIFTKLLFNHARKKPLVSVIGPSGSGKSSLVFAGLLPHLGREGGWSIASLRPRDRPFRALAAALIPLLATQTDETELLLQINKLTELLQRGAFPLYDVVERILEKQKATRCLLFIDQFEELYTNCRDPDERQRFLDILLKAIQAASQQKSLTLTLVLTLRADFLGQVLLYRPFADVLQNADLKLSPMNDREIQDAIRKPSEQLNVKIEVGLTERILDAIRQKPGNLPLLEFTLKQLWDKQRSNKLTHDAYDKIGHIDQSLASYAENIYTELGEKEQQQARRIFIQLIHPGKGTEDTRRIATRIQMGEESWDLVGRLSDARLIVTDQDELTGEETAEIVHEALIRGWSRLHTWMEEDREFRLWQDRLQSRMNEWERTNYSQNELLRGVMLAESEKWLEDRITELNDIEKSFIQESRVQQIRENQRLQRLQQIGNTFSLAKLVEDVYQYVNNVVDVSSMLLTFYDNDMRGIYDVFAVDKGKRIEGLLDHPVVTSAVDRPVWWRVTQQEQKTLLISLADLEQSSYGEYEELLKGTWGDQSKAETFLLLPMKISTQVVGSLSLSNVRSRAYTPEEILMLETMVQIIAVSIENAKLYEKSRHSLRRAKQREESLAAMNSALLMISTVLNLAELLYKFVETVATLVQAEMCTFFQLSADGSELVAQAIFDIMGHWNRTTRRGDPSWTPGKDKHDDLLEMIRLPFKGSILEHEIEVESFFYLDADKIEEIVQISGEGGAIFLRETHIEKMLMLPVRYQTEIVGILAVHTPRLNRVFRPEEVGVLLAISAQAGSAIRNAQLFEKIQEAYAELQRMDKLKDEFIGTASFEFRTPLSAISGYASLLRRQSTHITPQQVLRYASKIAGSAQQLTDLVANMTEAAKMGALEKKLDLQLGPVQVLAAAEMASTMLSVNIEQQIIVQITPDLWVNCDALPLRQVITNLLDNAAKYSPPNSRITIAAHVVTLSQLPVDQINYTAPIESNDSEVVHVRVIDEGEGIPLEDQERIFEKFVRGSRSLISLVRGSGLGLYISRRYIEAMGGRLWLEQSILQRGSVFSFYLPRIDAPLHIIEQDDKQNESYFESEQKNTILTD